MPHNNTRPVKHVSQAVDEPKMPLRIVQIAATQNETGGTILHGVTKDGTVYCYEYVKNGFRWVPLTMIAAEGE